MASRSLQINTLGDAPPFSAPKPLSPLSRGYLRPCLCEFLCTMMFVFIGCAPGQLEQPKVLAISLTNGFVIIAVVFAAARISGGHVNPVVTLSFMILKKEPVKRGLLYIVCQLLGAICGSAWLLTVYPLDATSDSLASLNSAHYGAHFLPDGVSELQGVLMEALLTFTLIFVVLRVAIDADGVGDMAATPIGLCVTLLCIVGINVTCASMNPARSFGPAVVGNIWTNHWIYWVGPISGSVAATFTYKFLFATNENESDY